VLILYTVSIFRGEGGQQLRMHVTNHFISEGACASATPSCRHLHTHQGAKQLTLKVQLKFSLKKRFKCKQHGSNVILWYLSELISLAKMPFQEILTQNKRTARTHTTTVLKNSTKMKLIPKHYKT